MSLLLWFSLVNTRPLASSWEQRKAAQRAALEAKARHKEELFRAAMEVGGKERGWLVNVCASPPHWHAELSAAAAAVVVVVLLCLPFKTHWLTRCVGLAVCACLCVLQRKRAAEAAEREAEFQQLYSEVLGGLAPGHDGVLTEVQEVLAYADSAQRTRKEALCKQWHKQVFEPIQVGAVVCGAGVWRLTVCWFVAARVSSLFCSSQWVSMCTAAGCMYAC